MSERNRMYRISVTEQMIEFYKIEKKDRGTFLLQVDWLLENAVYPVETAYIENLLELWNVYMPIYPFDKIVLDYANKNYKVLRYVHAKKLQEFKSAWMLQECALKNYIKFQISQEITSRMQLVQECFHLLKDISDRNKLYDLVNQAIETYFTNGEISQDGAMFLKRFQDCLKQPYVEILERAADIQKRKEQFLGARTKLFESLDVGTKNEEEFQTLLNVLLCRLAMVDGENRFYDVLRNVWAMTFPGIPYDEKVYDFIEKYERPYMNVAVYSIPKIKKMEFIRYLYKDAAILCAALDAIERNSAKFGLREIESFWKNDGMPFAGGFFFDDEYERMKAGLNREILLQYKSEILNFHDSLLKIIENFDARTKAVDSIENFSARTKLFESLDVGTKNEEEFQTLLNVLLCRLAMVDRENRFSDVLRDVWAMTFPGIPYDEKVYDFIEKYEKPYMNVAVYSIPKIKKKEFIRYLYKDAVILRAVLDAIERNSAKFGLREIESFWKNDGMPFAKSGSFDDEYERMKAGLNREILLQYKSEIMNFHDSLLKEFGKRKTEKTEKSELDSAIINEKGRQIEGLREQIAELEEKIETTEKEVLSQFISLLDSKKYDYVLGKLYRTAYFEKSLNILEIQRTLKNLFEIMNISGIDIYGEIGTRVSVEEIKKGKYRVDAEISGEAEIKYPGYGIGNTVILRPVAEEKSL